MTPEVYTKHFGYGFYYCIAFSLDGAMNVTRRYVRAPQYQKQRSTCIESTLSWAIDYIRSLRRVGVSKEDRVRLQHRDDEERKELEGYWLESLIKRLPFKRP